MENVAREIEIEGIAQELKEISESIENIHKGFIKIKKESGLTEKALVLLICHYSREKQQTVKNVLDALYNLDVYLEKIKK